MNNKTIDKELELILERENQSKWLTLMMALCEIEKKLDFKIEKFWYNRGELIVKHDNEHLMLNLGENYVENSNKDKSTSTEGDKLGS